MSSSQNETPIYGGQAVIEGVMMRGKNAYAVAVRDPQDNIVIHTEPLNARIYNSMISRTPFLRGLTLLWDALGLGMKSLMFSADVAIPPEESISVTKASADDSSDESKTERDPSEIFQEPFMIGAVALSLTLSIGLFILAPAAIAEFFVPQPESHILSNAVEGAVRLILVIGYIWAIGRMPDIQRVFGYHGAEHKTINAFEAGAELNPETVATYPLEHPRCGTGFLLTVVIISILLFTLIPPFDFGFVIDILLRLGSRLLLIPVVAGIAYEFLRFTARHQDNAFVRAITAPNMALQKLTTREPDLAMIEVAIAAFEQVRNVDLEKIREQSPAFEEAVPESS